MSDDGASGVVSDSDPWCADEPWRLDADLDRQMVDPPAMNAATGDYWHLMARYAAGAVSALLDDRAQLRTAVRAFLDAHDAGRSVREEMAVLRSQLGSDKHQG